MFKFNKSAGQASRLLLVLAIVVLVAVVITYLILKMTERPAPPDTTTTPDVVLPVYEQTLDNIRFVYQSSINRGDTLRAADVTKKPVSPSQKDLYIGNPGAKFIQVTVGAQNKGTENTGANSWNIENIVDSEGRNFIPETSNVSPWLPIPNLCGSILRPAFDPTSCTKIYQVSKESKGLKIRVIVKNSDSKEDSFLLDLIVK